MNLFTKMITGPRQWTHPSLRREVIERYGELQRANPDANELKLYNAAVEIVRSSYRVDSEKLRHEFNLRGTK